MTLNTAENNSNMTKQQTTHQSNKKAKLREIASSYKNSPAEGSKTNKKSSSRLCDNRKAP